MHTISEVTVAGETVQQLRALAGLPENQVQLTAPTWQLATISNSSMKMSETLWQSPRTSNTHVQVYIQKYIHTQTYNTSKTHIHIKF